MGGALGQKHSTTLMRMTNVLQEKYELFYDMENNTSHNNEFLIKRFMDLFHETKKVLHTRYRDDHFQDKVQLKAILETRATRDELKTHIDIMEYRLHMPSYKINNFFNKLICK